MVADAAPSVTNPPRLLTQLSRELVGELRAYLTQHRARQEGTPGEPPRGFETARGYSKMYDGVLSALFGACHAAMADGEPWGAMSLAAVGSYGRNMLSPFSDLDVRLVCASDPAAAAPLAEALLYPLWDAGLSVGHQVVTLDDLLELALEDVTTATTLLDFRTIVGDRSLGHTLFERAYQTVFSSEHLGEFVDRLEQRARARHQRFGDSVYLLEPDVKNGAGGLRDLDIAHWCARARFRVSDLSELTQLGILLPREWAEVEAARNLLLTLRHALHRCVGRRTDRLTFDLQERVTERLGRGEGMAATERLMSDYYRAARIITRLAETLLSRARPSSGRRSRKQPLGAGVVLCDGCISIESPELLADDPVLALRLYDEAVQRDVPISESTRQELVHAASGDEFGVALRESPLARELFLKLLCVVRKTRLRQGSALFDLHDVGLLVAMIPEFATLVGRVHRDTYHVYTVDVHSVAAVDHLRAMCRGELSSQHPLGSRLASELPRHRVLFLAVLLHDIGKAYGGEGHTERGVTMSRAILTRLGIAERDLLDVQHLIQNHLSMYEVATRRDLEDPQTLGEFCATVRERQTLHELYLLTIADVTTTNPSSMSNWKRRMLDTLFVAAERTLGAGGAPLSSRTASIRASVLALWPEQADRVFIEHFISGLPERYFFANEPAAIVEHALFAESAAHRSASMRQGLLNHPYFELWVVADDRPGLLALITATLSRYKLKVRSAQVYSWISRDGRSRCLDIFWVRGPEDAERAQRLLPKLEAELEQSLGEEIDPVQLEARALSGAPPTRPSLVRFATEVNVDNKSASNYSIIEVITLDRPALLFVLSMALQQVGLSIWFAKINTEGERVIDVFYVLSESGQKVLDPAEIAGIRSAIGAAIERLDVGSAPGSTASTALRTAGVSRPAAS
jgi:[protein-PII] uridylyltransferase